MTTSTPPQVDRAEIRRELDRFVLRSVQPMGLRVLSVDDAVAVAAARELVSRQEIGRLRAENERLTAVIDQVRSVILVGGQSAAIRANWVCQALDAAGLLTPSPGVSETPEAGL